MVKESLLSASLDDDDDAGCHTKVRKNDILKKNIIPLMEAFMDNVTYSLETVLKHHVIRL